jgi:hypothetical protein
MVLEIKLGSGASEVAAQWLEKYSLQAVIGLTPIACGPEGKLREAARDCLKTMHLEGHAQVMESALDYLPSEEANWLRRFILD